MKKLLLSLCLLFALTLSSEAQVRPPHRYRHHPRRTVVQPRERHEPRHYYPIGEFRFHAYGDLGYGDFGAILMHDIPYHFSVGGMAEYQVGHFTSLGIGAEYFSTYGDDCRLFRNMQETYLHAVPVYANLKLSLPKTPISPFIEGRVGYTVPAGTVTCNDHDGVHHYMSTGLFTGGDVGLKIYRANISCGVAVIDVVDSDLGVSNGRKDVITDYYVRLSIMF